MHTAFPGLTETEIERLPERFLRFTALQRVQHWLLVLSFGALLLTGLPQRFHDVGLSLQVIDALGGIDNARFLHRIFASIFTIESAWHVVEMGLRISRGRFHPTMFFTTQDFRDLVGMLRYSLGFMSERPQFDRYDYRQKFEYWGIVFGAIIMVATGATLWFPTYLTRLLPGELIPAAKEMHSGEALLAMLVIVIWHFYDIMLSPAVFPLDTGMITGKISREKLMEEHPREFARILESGLHEPDDNAAHSDVPGELPGTQRGTRDAPQEET
jgi:formate dehydrogenase subunit gamma